MRIDAKLLDQLRRLADDDLRSLNGEIEYLLRDALRRRGLPTDSDRPANPASRHEVE